MVRRWASLHRRCLERSCRLSVCCHLSLACATSGVPQEDSYHVQEQLGSPSLGETQGYTLQDPQHATDDSGTLLTGAGAKIACMQACSTPWKHVTIAATCFQVAQKTLPFSACSMGTGAMRSPRCGSIRSRAFIMTACAACYWTVSWHMASAFQLKSLYDLTISDHLSLRCVAAPAALL